MNLSFELADTIFKSPKRLVKPLLWREILNNANVGVRLSLESRIIIDQTIPRGIFFRATSLPSSLTRLVFQLECDNLQSRSRILLYRFELNPERPHTNNFNGPPEIAGLRFEAGVPHEHLFYDSVTPDANINTTAVAHARAISSPPVDFPTAVSYVCSRINIINGEECPPPTDQGRLF